MKPIPNLLAGYKAKRRFNNLTLDDIFHIKEVSEDTKKYINERLSRTTIKNVSYGLKTYQITEVHSRPDIMKKVTSTNKCVVFLDVSCHFHRYHRSREFETWHNFYTLGRDDKLYRISIVTFIYCNILTKFYDDELIVLTSVIAQDIIDQNKRFKDLSKFDISIPNYSDLSVYQMMNYEESMIKVSNQSIKDGLFVDRGMDELKFYDDKDDEKPESEVVLGGYYTTNTDDCINIKSSMLLHTFKNGKNEEIESILIKADKELENSDKTFITMNIDDIINANMTLEDIVTKTAKKGK